MKRDLYYELLMIGEVLNTFDPKYLNQFKNQQNSIAGTNGVNTVYLTLSNMHQIVLYSIYHSLSKGEKSKLLASLNISSQWFNQKYARKEDMMTVHELSAASSYFGTMHNLINAVYMAHKDLQNQIAQVVTAQYQTLMNTIQDQVI